MVEGRAHDSLGPPHARLSRGLDALAAYMDSLDVPISPYNDDPESIQRGRSTFTSLNCQTCHGPPLYTDLQLHDVGTGDPATEKNSHDRGTSFDTPSLRSLWLTQPYFHDGSATTLEDVLKAGTVHNITDDVTADDLSDLVAFLLSLPNED